MVKTKEQRKAKREERAWNTWLWGSQGNAVWDENGRTALSIDQALRQNARAAAADVSRVESEQFAWQAGRWGHQPSTAQGDGDLLKAALASLGSCSLNEIRETQKSSTSEFDSKSQSSGDETEARTSTEIASTSGKSDNRHNNSLCREVYECRKCGFRGSSTDDITLNPSLASGFQCQCKFTRQLSRELHEETGGLAGGLTTWKSWPMYSFGVERPIHCSCLWSADKAGEFVGDTRRKRLGNSSPVDRVPDDVL